MATLRALLLALLTLPACATLPEQPSDPGLPSANAGPFRALTSLELGNNRSSPNGLDDSRNFGRDMAVIDVDGKPDTLEVAGYVAAGIRENGMDPAPDAPTRSIVRYGALDGRSFDRSALVVLTPDQPWEGNVLAAPAVVRVGPTFFLYYAAAGGIGLARGTDGMTFTKEAAPVLAPSAGGWEQGATPGSPGVVKLDDGSFRMFYEVPIAAGETAIGEARSDDGVSFTRIGTKPALRASPLDTGDAGDQPYDDGSVGSPFPMLAVSGDGRPILRLYYGARDLSGGATIGLAARYGVDGAFQRAVAPVFGTSKPLEPREPCVVVFEKFTMLYATEQSSTTDEHPAVAVGVSPGTAVLPPPNPR
jgi:hypothetical protein